MEVTQLGGSAQGKNQLKGPTCQGLDFFDRADALSTMVATQLGGGRWRGARHSARVALCLAAAVMAVAGAVIGAGRNVWPRLFTHDAQACPSGTPQPFSTMLHLFLALQAAGGRP